MGRKSIVEKEIERRGGREKGRKRKRKGRKRYANEKNRARSKKKM